MSKMTEIDHRSHKALVEMLAANVYAGGVGQVTLTMEDAAVLATNLAPLVERIINARVNAVRKEMEAGYAG